MDNTFNVTLKTEKIVSEKSRTALVLFSWILGWLAVDRFYLGKVGTGILKLITLNGFGIWYLYDLILAIAGLTKDKEGNLIKNS